MVKTSSSSWYSSARMARMAVGCLVVWWCLWMNHSVSTSCEALREGQSRQHTDRQVPEMEGAAHRW